MWRASGLTAAEFSEGRDFAPASLRWWSSRLRAVRAEVPRPMQMARVIRQAAPAPTVEMKPTSSRDAILVELAGARVLVPEGADRSTLAAVFAALESRAR